MVTDGWEGVKSRFARLLGRGDAKKTEATAASLEQSRVVLAGLSGPALEQARGEQEIVWRTRLGDLLEQEPAAEQGLRDLVAEGQAQGIGSACRVEQDAAALDTAQHAGEG